MKSSISIQITHPLLSTAMRCFLLFVAVAFAHSLFSQSTWTGATSDNWNTATNWDTGTVPTATDDVIIPNAATDPIITSGTGAVAKSVLVQTNGHLTIENGASLTIENSSAKGLRNNGTIENAGILTINNTGQNGIVNNSSFTNNGTINIDNTGSAGTTVHQRHGIFNQNGIFTNTSKINIGLNGGTNNIRGNGLFSKAVFNNNSGGEISVKRTASSGIQNDNFFHNNAGASVYVGTIGYYISFWNYGTVNNSGSMDIKETQVCFTNNNNFNNLPCGIIDFVGRFESTSNASFTNDGFCTLLNFGTGQNGTFVNNGVLKSDWLPGIFTNNEIFIGPTDALSCSAAISPAFVLGSPVDFAVDGVFTDGAATISAGTYVLATNTFYPDNNVLSPGANILYVKITDGTNGCSHVFPWQIEVTDNEAPKPLCKNIEVQLDASHTATITAVDVDNGSYDNCGIASLSIPPTTFDCDDVGAQSVVLTVTDNNGLTATCTATITVKDDDNPCCTTPMSTTTWTGAVDDNWDNHSNWTDCVPGTITNAIIPNTATAPVIHNGTDAFAKNVEVRLDASLQISGNLKIENSIGNDPHGLYIAPGATVLNMGTLTIDNTADNGIHVVGGHFVNQNVVNIGTNGGANNVRAGIEIINQGMFTNQAGTVIIKNSEAGFLIVNGTAENYASLQISNIATWGIYNFADGIFNNKASGSIGINFTTSHKIRNEGTALNEGQIDIGSNGQAAALGIRNTASFTNAPCATINMDDNFSGAAGSVFTNNGSFTINTSQAHTNNGTFINNGVLTYLKTAQIPNVTNHEIIIAKTIVSLCPTSLSPAFSLGATVDFTIDGIYADPAATVSAGTYDLAINAFTPSTPLQANTTHTFYVKTTNTANGCASRISEWQVETVGTKTCYADTDGDGFGDAANSITDCACPAGYVEDNTDCDDAHATVYPNAPEICDGLDNDCDGFIEMPYITNVETTPESCMGYADGFIEIIAEGSGQLRYSVDGGATWQLVGLFNFIGAGEYTVMVEDNSNGCSATMTVILPDGPAPSIWYKDLDGDGYSDGNTLTQCEQPEGYQLAADLTATSGDCNDENADEFPGQIWWKDMDGDGYSDGESTVSCSQPVGYVLDLPTGDCDDSEPAINPGAAEICNGIDDDCDGEIDEEAAGGLIHVGNVVFTNQAQVDAFSQCYSVIDGQLHIFNAGITDIANLINLTEVTGNVFIKSTSLTSLNGLDNLTTIGGFLKIQTNNSLATLDGLEAVASVGSYLRIFRNDNLTDCCAIHDLLQNGGVGGSITIMRNETGCDSVSEVEDDCAGGPLFMAPMGDDILTNSISGDVQNIDIFPNPAFSDLNIRFAKQVENGSVKLMDMRGGLLRSVMVNDAWQAEMSVNDLPAGIYLVRMELDGEMFTERLMVK